MTHHAVASAGAALRQDGEELPLVASTKTADHVTPSWAGPARTSSGSPRGPRPRTRGTRAGGSVRRSWRRHSPGLGEVGVEVVDVDPRHVRDGRAFRPLALEPEEEERAVADVELDPRRRRHRPSSGRSGGSNPNAVGEPARGRDGLAVVQREVDAREVPGARATRWRAGRTTSRTSRARRARTRSCP